MPHPENRSTGGKAGEGWPAWHRPCWLAVVLPLVLPVLAACQPTVKVEAPDKPIVINLNVKIEQDVHVKVERDVDAMLDKNHDLFQ